jgi:hypothetical protein
MASVITSNTGSGLALQPDASGQLQFSTGYGGTQLTLANNVLTLGSTTNVSMGSNSVMTMGDGTQYATANSFGMRNRIINGAMVIDQRNSGASVTANTSSVYPVDRWFLQNNDVATNITAQRSSTVPNSTFSNSVVLTTTTAINTSAAQQVLWQHRIEGYNVADFAYGTAAALPITLSFWVRSSITGLYGGSINNGSASYVFTYNINATNTWQSYSITIPGTTAYAFANTTNSTGLYLVFDLGSGTNFETTAGVWIAGDYKRTSACVKWANNATATWYCTGVQLEVGTVATPFERRLYGTELALCQRYYYKWTPNGNRFAFPINLTDIYRRIIVWYKTSMRANPTCTLTAATNGTFAASQPLVETADTETAACNMDVTTSSALSWITLFTASAEL